MKPAHWFGWEKNFMRVINDYHPWNVISDFSFPALCCSKSFAPYHKGYSIFFISFLNCGLHEYVPLENGVEQMWVLQQRTEEDDPDWVTTQPVLYQEVANEDKLKTMRKKLSLYCWQKKADVEMQVIQTVIYMDWQQHLVPERSRYILTSWF